MKTFVHLVLAFALLHACPLSAWDLPGIYANAPNVWKEGRNWKWSDGNPMPDNGATWTLLYQPTEDDQSLRPMKPGKAYTYHFVWRDEGDSFDPLCFYKEHTLISMGSKGGPGKAPRVALMFSPDNPGEFRIQIAGAATAQNPTAGNALVTLAIVNDKCAEVRVVKEFNLNAKGGHGDFPATFEWSDTVHFALGEGFAVFLRSINPGPGSCGRSTLSLEKFAAYPTAP